MTDTIEMQKLIPEGSPLAVSGLNFFVPPPYSEHTEWQIVGADSQVAEVALPPGRSLLVEPGCMLHMTGGFKPSISSGGCTRGCMRCCLAHESFFRVTYYNQSQSTEVIAITPNFPAKIIPFDLTNSGGLTVKSGAFMASFDIKAEFKYRFTSCGAGCCGGQGFVLNSIRGDGIVFLAAGGTILHKQLADGETILVDTESIVAFEDTCHFDIQRAGGCCMMCCGGEGLFNTKLTGPGHVYMQSLPFEKLARKVAQKAQAQ